MASGMLVAIGLMSLLVLYAIPRLFRMSPPKLTILFYGSSIPNIKTLIPQPSRVIENEKAVFATSSYLDAVVFSTLWTDRHFEFGSVNGVKYLIEKYPGALSKLDKQTYIYQVSSTSFQKDSRLGMSSEYISRSEVKTMSCAEVNPKNYIHHSSINVIEYDTFVKLVRTSPREEFLTRAILGHKTYIYLPLDPYHVPEIIQNIWTIDDAPLKHQQGNSFNTTLTLDKNVYYVGDIISSPYNLYDFVDLAKKQNNPDICHPQIYVYGIELHSTPELTNKITKEEYDQFIRERRFLFETFQIPMINASDIVIQDNIVVLNSQI